MVRTFFSRMMIAAVIASPAIAVAQPSVTARPVTQADVGRFLRDQDGSPIGSLHAIHGDQAVVWYGFVNTPGNHLATVPLGAISIRGGQLVLNGQPASSVAAR